LKQQGKHVNTGVGPAQTAKDWEAPLQPISVTQEAWEDPSEEEDLDTEGEGVPVEELALDNPTARELLG
jgi:hypothetical protein